MYQYFAMLDHSHTFKSPFVQVSWDEQAKAQPLRKRRKERARITALYLQVGCVWGGWLNAGSDGHILVVLPPRHSHTQGCRHMHRYNDIDIVHIYCRLIGMVTYTCIMQTLAEVKRGLLQAREIEF